MISLPRFSFSPAPRAFPWQGWKPHQLPGGIHCFPMKSKSPVWHGMLLSLSPWRTMSSLGLAFHDKSSLRVRSDRASQQCCDQKCLSWARHLLVSFQILIPLELHNDISESFSDIFSGLEHSELSPKFSTHQSPRNICKLVQQQVLLLLVQN